MLRLSCGRSCRAKRDDRIHKMKSGSSVIKKQLTNTTGQVTGILTMKLLMT